MVETCSLGCGGGEARQIIGERAVGQNSALHYFLAF